MSVCFVAKLDGTGPCDGRLVRAHLLRKSRIRDEFRDGAWPSSVEDGRLVPEPPVVGLTLREARKLDGYRSLKSLVEDPRGWRWVCGGPMGDGGHHADLDGRTAIGGVRLPRELVPEDVEAFAAELGMTWSLDRDFKRGAAT